MLIDSYKGSPFLVLQEQIYFKWVFHCVNCASTYNRRLLRCTLRLFDENRSLGNIFSNNLQQERNFIYHGLIIITSPVTDMSNYNDSGLKSFFHI